MTICARPTSYQLLTWASSSARSSLPTRDLRSPSKAAPPRFEQRLSASASLNLREGRTHAFATTIQNWIDRRSQYHPALSPKAAPWNGSTATWGTITVPALLPHVQTRRGRPCPSGPGPAAGYGRQKMVPGTPYLVLHRVEESVARRWRTSYVASSRVKHACAVLYINSAMPCWWTVFRLDTCPTGYC